MSTSAILSSLHDLPAQAPPPGITADLAHPESKGYILIIVSSVLFALMMAFAVAYFIASIIGEFLVTVMKTKTQSSILLNTMELGVTRGPVGKHQWDVTIGDVTNNDFIIVIIPSPFLSSPPDSNHPTSTSQAVAFLSNALVSPTLLLTKLTLFLLYLDLFRPFKWLRICVYIGISITVLFYSTTGILMIIWSSPHAGETWQTHLFTMEQQYAQIYASPWSAVGLGIDLFLLGLPLKAVGELCLPWKKKVVVGIVFLTGILWSNTKDTTYALQNVIICSLAEMFTGVIVSCMPATWELLRQCIPHFLALKSKFLFASRSFWKKGKESLSQGEVASERDDSGYRKGSVPLHRETNDLLKGSWEEERLAKLGVELARLGNGKVYFGAGKRFGWVDEAPDESYLQRDVW
ncbi:hypothetical protein BHYA_0131g00210 [Botrytis hyacinthi]|uniref:Rhodopsin domain-containing protein n=1 Tax=Botrytis hyacinthi TaxID=278943 RepID=A0A4Z1GRH4_9HELO|nr:hypothetical protein BHYA_0131g00210 [Botrytis hyacinthi]